MKTNDEKKVIEEFHIKDEFGDWRHYYKSINAETGKIIYERRGEYVSGYGYTYDYISKRDYLIGKIKYLWVKIKEWEGWKFVLLLLLILFIFCLIVWLPYLVDKHNCETFSTLINIPYMYDFWAGCFVNHPQFGWINLDDFSAILLGK